MYIIEKQTAGDLEEFFPDSYNMKKQTNWIYSECVAPYGCTAHTLATVALQLCDSGEAI